MKTEQLDSEWQWSQSGTNHEQSYYC